MILLINLKIITIYIGLNTKIPKEIQIYKFEEFDRLLKSNVDLIVLGILKNRMGGRST